MKRLIKLYIIIPVVATWIILMTNFAFADLLHFEGTYLKKLDSGNELVKIEDNIYAVDHSNLKLNYGDCVVVILEQDKDSIVDSWILRKK